MGVVYEAHDPALGRTIALKTIHPTAAASAREQAAFEQRFFSEARIAARLSHPGIVIVHDVGRDAASRTLYIALEHLRGDTLGERIADGRPLPWRDALRLMARVAEALEHAHANGVIHRDIKPANIMILESGEPKIMDFGIAKIETAHFKLTSPGEFFGTPLYMAPEQALSRAVDARTDIFSLGAVTYTALTGIPAFAEENIPRILSRVVGVDPIPPSRLVPGIPDVVDYLIGRSMAKAPADRYASALDLADDAEDVLADAPPRHRSGWRPPEPSATLAAVAPSVTLDDDFEVVDESGEDTLEEQIAALVSDEPGWDVSASEGEALRVRAVPGASDTAHGAQTVRDGPDERAFPAPPERSGVSLPNPSSGVYTPQVDGGPWRVAQARPASIGRLVVWGGLAGAAFGAVLIAAWATNPRGEPAAPSARATPVAPPPSVASRPTPVDEPSPAPSHAAAPAPAPAPPPAASAGTRGARTPSPVVEPGRLAIEFDHHLKTGALRVWVDDELVLDDTLDAQVEKKVVLFRMRKGSYKEVLEVPAGAHRVRVQVRWDDNERTESIEGAFTSGSTRTLDVSVGRLRKNLSLEWK
jgi:serine/threonine-protein kinase